MNKVFANNMIGLDASKARKFEYLTRLDHFLPYSNSTRTRFGNPVILELDSKYKMILASTRKLIEAGAAEILFNQNCNFRRKLEIFVCLHC